MGKVHLTINGKQIEADADMSVLEAAKHHHGVGEPDHHLVGVVVRSRVGLAVDLSGVGHGDVPVGDDQSDPKRGLERRLVPTRKRPSGVGRFELGDHQVLGVARLIVPAGPVHPS